jgi:putative RNA 2'-phosphotransferase
MSKSDQRISRVMSLVLRHDPGSIGLTLDENGWVEVDKLIDCLQRDGKRVDRERIENIVAESDKQRFRISDDGRLIRANQGHSIEIDLKLDE